MQTKELVKRERSALKQILLNLVEIEKRSLYPKRGYSSMFAFCTRSLGYSEAAAGRRIEAMRAIKDVPEVAEKIEQGKLTLSSVALAQKSIRQAQKTTAKVISPKKKEEIFSNIKGKSGKESEKVLIKEFPQLGDALRPDRTKLLTETQTEIRFVADEALMEKLQLIRQKFLHKNVSPTYNELFQMMYESSIEI